MADASDENHLVYATEQGRTILSADQDFLQIHAEWMAGSKLHAGIIFIKQERKNDIGGIVEFLVFLHSSVIGGAAKIDTDIFNTVLFY